MNDEGPDVNRIHSTIVNTVIVAGIIGLVVIVPFALNQKQEPTDL